jgi:urea carboxylase
MHHPVPRFSPAGDSFIEVELGDEMSFDLNVKVQALAYSIREADIEGVIELVPELASLLVSYDPDRISYDDVVMEIQSISAQQSGDGITEMPSRLFYVPLYYFDPWTEECMADYRKTYPDKVPDPELLCQTNGLTDRAALQRMHSGTEYWVAALGFWPGLCSLMPLDPRARLTAPKYNPPRGWTPKGTIGVGGGLTCIQTARRAATRYLPVHRCQSGTRTSGLQRLGTVLPCSGLVTGSALPQSEGRSTTSSRRR